MTTTERGQSLSVHGRRRKSDPRDGPVVRVRHQLFVSYDFPVSSESHYFIRILLGVGAQGDGAVLTHGSDVVLVSPNGTATSTLVIHKVESNRLMLKTTVRLFIRCLPDTSALLTPISVTH